MTKLRLLFFNAEIMGRLDHLVELVYERFVNRYFPGESKSVILTNPSVYISSSYILRGLRGC